MTKKVSSALLALCFLLPCLAGCANKEAADKTANTQTSTAFGTGPALTTTGPALTATAPALATADSGGSKAAPATPGTSTATAEDGNPATSPFDAGSAAQTENKAVELTGKPTALTGNGVDLAGKSDGASGKSDLTGNAADANIKPVDLTNGKPVALTGQPVALTGQPVALTGKPVALTGKPVSLTGQPVSLTGQPVSLTSGKSIALTSGKPVELVGKPVALTVNETPKEIRIDMATDVLFDFDKSTLLPKAKQTLHRAAAIIRDKAKGVVRIEGYTDGKGSDAYNQKLSERRANAVRDWFTKTEGLSAVQFSTQGFGASNPVAPNKNADGSDNPAGRQKNRRVTLVITK